jgi:hypothetical protein
MSKKEDNNKPLSDIKFYAAILYPDGDYRVEQFDTAEELAAKLKSLIDKDVSVFNFAGVQLKVSKPPFRHLLTPWGSTPLFNAETNMEPDESGYLGVDPIHLAEPPQLSAPNASRAMPDDDFFDDKDDNSLGVFDNVLPDPDS